MSEPRVVVIQKDETIMLTVPGWEGRACVYVDLSKDGKLLLAGGANIIESILGEGMESKIPKG